jgi:hypothetical protein
MDITGHIYLPKLNKLGLGWPQSATIEIKLDILICNIPDLFSKIE